MNRECAFVVLAAMFASIASIQSGTPLFTGPNTSVTSTAFGQVTAQAYSPRQLQFGLKFLW